MECSREENLSSSLEGDEMMQTCLIRPESWKSFSTIDVIDMKKIRKNYPTTTTWKSMFQKITNEIIVCYQKLKRTAWLEITQQPQHE